MLLALPRYIWGQEGLGLGVCRAVWMAITHVTLLPTNVTLVLPTRRKLCQLALSHFMCRLLDSITASSL